MLDVHPPHEAAHTWKDFFIHIATIVVGLLIAIGLEQTVEAIHHRHQVKEVREALRLERENNQSIYAFNTASFRYVAAQLANDVLVLTYLKQHPGTPMEKLPGTLRWDFQYLPAQDVAWKAAQQNGITAFMPTAEVTGNQYLYRFMAITEDQAEPVWQAIGKAQQLSLIDPNPSHLSPGQVDTELDLLSAAMEANYRWGLVMAALHGNFPELTPAPTSVELSNLQTPGLDSQRKILLAVPNALTNARLSAAQAARDKATTALGVLHKLHEGKKQR